MSDDKWEQPQEISDVFLAFPASVVDTMMPSREDCEAALAAMEDGGKDWLRFQRETFQYGIRADAQDFAKPGVDGPTAVRHIAAIQGSFEPKHEHKVVAVAYLASRWFTQAPVAAA